MDITLQKIGLEQAQRWLALQIEAYMPTFERYRDTETSPTRDSIEVIRCRMAHPACSFFFILLDRRVVGGVHVHSLENRPRDMRLAGLFVLPGLRDRGVGRRALALAEGLFPQAESWELHTILQEARNIHLYTSMGYVRQGEAHRVNDRMDLGLFRKQVRP